MSYGHCPECRWFNVPEGCATEKDSPSCKMNRGPHPKGRLLGKDRESDIFSGVAMGSQAFGPEGPYQVDGTYLDANGCMKTYGISSKGTSTESFIIDTWYTMELPELEAVRSLSLKLWFRMVRHGGGHPGCMGPSQDRWWSPAYGDLRGTIQALTEVADKMFKDQIEVSESPYKPRLQVEFMTFEEWKATLAPKVAPPPEETPKGIFDNSFTGIFDRIQREAEEEMYGKYLMLEFIQKVAEPLKPTKEKKVTP
jgi:hypothetical protein